MWTNCLPCKDDAGAARHGPRFTDQPSSQGLLRRPGPILIYHSPQARDWLERLNRSCTCPQNQFYCPRLLPSSQGPACRHLERFHLSGSADILVCGFAGHSCPVFHPYESGDWKVARTRRLESLRYIITVNALLNLAQVGNKPSLDTERVHAASTCETKADWAFSASHHCGR